MALEPTIHIVDDDDAVRTMLGALIGTVYPRVNTCSSAREFIETYQPGRGCLVLDVRMPSMSGLELQEELIRRAIDLPIIFLTGHGDIPMAVQALRKGAYDFIEKPFDNQLLLDRIQSALASTDNGEDNLDELGEIRARLKALTAREQEVLELVIEGATNKGVARELGISSKTVEVHRANVMTKMAANSFASLVRMATQAKNL